jgi:adenylate cyclase
MQLDKMAEVIEAFAYAVNGAPKVAAHGPVALALPEKPSIAVLPFSDMTGAKDQDYFTEGMLVEIVTALSAFPSLFVISHAASLSLRGDTRSHTLIARELGVRYILIGSVRKAGDRVRIAVELLEDGARTPIWNQRFDGTLEDVFALQDTVANAVASQIEPSIQAAEVRRATQRPTADPGAYDLYLRGLHAHWGLLHKESLQKAISYFDQALERDPNFALAHAHASNAHINLYISSNTDRPAETLRLALQSAQRAERLAGDDPDVLAYAAYSFFQCGVNLAVVDALFGRARTLNPGSSIVRYCCGWYYFYAGRHEAALAELLIGQRLDPRSPFGTILTLGVGMSLFGLRRFDEALPLLHQCLQISLPEMVKRTIASCYGHLGRHEDAKAAIADFAPEAPEVSFWLSLHRDPVFQALYDKGLALAAKGDAVR